MIALENLMAGLRVLLPALALPPTPLLLMMPVACLLRRRHPVWALALLIGAGAGVWLACTEVGSTALQSLLLGEAPLPLAIGSERLRDPQFKGHTAILVLGGGARQDVPEYASARLKPLSIERLNYGAWLSRRSGFPLAFSGGLPRNERAGDQSEAALAQAYLHDMQGLTLAWVEDQARDTRDNARYSAALLKPAGIRRLLLVTHAQHMPRALTHVRAAFGAEVEVLAAPIGLRRPDASFQMLDWLPSTDGLAQSRYAVYEWLAMRAGH